MADFLEDLYERLARETASFVITANPEILMLGKRMKDMDSALMDEHTAVVPDGIGLLKGGARLGYHLPERIPGVEICEALLRHADQCGQSVYLFGAAADVVEAVAKRIQNEYPGAVLLGYTDGYVQDKDAVMQKITSLRPDLTFVALGAPAQELLIHRHYKAAGKGIYVGVGGSFDVLSGMKRRAPDFFIRHNLEWLYRITKEPKRLKRFWENNIRFLAELERERRRRR